MYCPPVYIIHFYEIFFLQRAISLHSPCAFPIASKFWFFEMKTNSKYIMFYCIIFYKHVVFIDFFVDTYHNTWHHGFYDTIFFHKLSWVLGENWNLRTLKGDGWDDIFQRVIAVCFSDNFWTEHVLAKTCLSHYLYTINMNISCLFVYIYVNIPGKKYEAYLLFRRAPIDPPLIF